MNPLRAMLLESSDTSPDQETWIVEFGDRLDFEVVAQPEAERRAVRDAPFVLGKRRRNATSDSYPAGWAHESSTAQYVRGSLAL